MKEKKETPHYLMFVVRAGHHTLSQVFVVGLIPALSSVILTISFVVPMLLFIIPALLLIVPCFRHCLLSSPCHLSAFFLALVFIGIGICQCCLLSRKGTTGPVAALRAEWQHRAQGTEVGWGLCNIIINR